MAFHVYVITHDPSGKVFVGTTEEPTSCWGRLRTSARQGKSPLSRAIERLGVEGFSFHVLKACRTPQAAWNERARLIKRLRANEPTFGFNCPAPKRPRLSRKAELARLIQEQQRDAKEDHTGLRSTIAGELLSGDA